MDDLFFECINIVRQTALWYSGKEDNLSGREKKIFGNSDRRKNESKKVQKRNEVLDNMKGLGVYLVIMGHMQSEEVIGIGV